MAVASCRAGRILARPLFCRLNMKVHILIAREVLRIRNYKPSQKVNLHHHANYEGDDALGFSASLA